MSNVEVASREMCAVAALLLKQSGQEVNVDNLSKVIDAAGAEVESYWYKIFAEAYQKVDVDAILKSSCSSGPAAPAAAAVSQEESAKPAEEAPKPAESESDDDMGFSLFD